MDPRIAIAQSANRATIIDNSLFRHGECWAARLDATRTMATKVRRWADVFRTRCPHPRYAGRTMLRVDSLAHELKLLIRLAGKSPEGLVGQLPVLSEFARVQAADPVSDEERVHLLIHDVVPTYAERLPDGPDGRAIRELLMSRDSDGQVQSLATRYHKASAHLYTATKDFGRRREPKLLRECARFFIQFDYEDRTQAAHGPLVAAGQDAPQRDRLALSARDQSSVGSINVHDHLDYLQLAREMRNAREITILNTWIPGLELFEDALREALEGGADVRILMLYPDSPAARMRTAGLRSQTGQVKRGVENCLDQLSALASLLDEAARLRLRVALYDSLPTIAVYSTDEHAFVAVFLHDLLAIDAPQLEVHGVESLFGRAVFNEIGTLWSLAAEFSDVRFWSSEIDGMAGVAAGQE